MTTTTSMMQAITTPSRFGFEVVDMFFGEVRDRRDQTIAVRGDLLRNIATGEIREFRGREGRIIHTNPL